MSFKVLCPLRAFRVVRRSIECLKYIINIFKLLLGMWTWQGGGAGGAAAGAAGEGGHAPHELSDMLQILDQSGPATFEDLNINMFNSNFE